MKHRSKVIVSGFAGSGSSAVVDLLSEIEGYFTLGKEFRLLTDPDGVMDLETALISGWSPYKSDLAIKRFRSLIRHLGKKNRYPYINQNFTRTLSADFIKISEEYIQELLSFSYHGVWVGINSPYTRWLKRLHKHFNLEIRKRLPEIFISYPREGFYDVTREYMEKLVDAASNKQTIEDTVIIDDPFSSLNCDSVLKYLHSSKILIIHRDPRDTFLNAVKYKYSFIPLEVDQFILWYRYMQEHTFKNTNRNAVLRINFEDMVLHYHETKQAIFDFLEISSEDHQSPLKYFNPEISGKNVQLWKNGIRDGDIQKIENELGIYCYNFGE